MKQEKLLQTTFPIRILSIVLIALCFNCKAQTGRVLYEDKEVSFLLVNKDTFACISTEIQKKVNIDYAVCDSVKTELDLVQQSNKNLTQQNSLLIKADSTSAEKYSVCKERNLDLEEDNQALEYKVASKEKKVKTNRRLALAGLGYVVIRTVIDYIKP